MCKLTQVSHKMVRDQRRPGIGALAPTEGENI